MQTIGIVIPVPEPHGQYLRDKRAGYGDARAETVPSHVTLVPPIEVAKSRLIEFDESLSELASTFPAFTMTLRGTGTFRPVSPVVFVGLVEGISVTEQLAKLIREVLELPAPRFDFHPHVTVAQELPDEALDRAFTELRDFEVSWTVDSFKLYFHHDSIGWTTANTYRFAND